MNVGWFQVSDEIEFNEFNYFVFKFSLDYLTTHVSLPNKGLDQKPIGSIIQQELVTNANDMNRFDCQIGNSSFRLL